MNYENIPAITREALDRYSVHHVPTGGFLRAVLSNDLMEAMGRADEENRAAIFDICGYVHNELPGNCHGSPDRVREWVKYPLLREVAS